jgi:hypothetical protein
MKQSTETETFSMSEQAVFSTKRPVFIRDAKTGGSRFYDRASFSHFKGDPL